MTARPLEGVRIIALEQYGAGPYGSVHLADLGAEVIKLEDPPTGGDISRYVTPYKQGEDSLLYASRTGVGMDCDVSLYDVAISFLSYPGTWHLTAGHEPERMSRSAHPSLVPFQAFRAADGWVVIGCAKEKFFSRMCAGLGCP